MTLAAGATLGPYAPSIPLTAGSPADDSQPAFSPDGERIAFRSEREGGGLFIMGATGESVRRVTGQGFDPAWSPDGKRLVYSTEPVFDPYSRQGRADLWTVEIVSGAAHARAIRTLRNPSASWCNPSPDGSWLACRTAGVPEDLVPTAGIAWHAVAGWLPDARHLVARSAEGVAVIDVATVSLSRDGRVLNVEREVLDADIWLMESR